jgi:NAD(P)-dependent dehydrogenase (short-subunit alcohol dehydrogenase family)
MKVDTSADTAINKPEQMPVETQERPGIEKEMSLQPEYIRPGYKGSGKLEGKTALITGGDSGIGRSVAVHFAREGADVAICYLKEEETDAQETKSLVEKEGRKCLLLPGDLRDKEYCKNIVDQTVKEFGKLNVLVNNAGENYYETDFLKLKDEDIEDIFDVNVISMFRVTREALKHLKEGDAIIMNASVNAYKGNEVHVDYSATKGAVISLVRSLAKQLAEKKIRINAVAPGPIWTPLIVSSLPKDKIKEFGKDSALGRAGQPSECGPGFVFLACDDSSYITGQCIHPNGGMIINS